MPDDSMGSRREIAYGEARAVIEAQNETVTEIDNKALRTVRLNAVLLGLLVSGLQFAPGQFHSPLLELAFGFLIVPTLCGIIAYNESNLYVGPRGEFIERLSGDDFPDLPWEEDLLRTMAGMIAENYDEIRRTAWWLTTTQLALFSSIATAVSAVAI
jgi:hypothetical protein